MVRRLSDNYLTVKARLLSTAVAFYIPDSKQDSSAVDSVNNFLHYFRKSNSLFSTQDLDLCFRNYKWHYYSLDDRSPPPISLAWANIKKGTQINILLYYLTYPFITQ